MVDPLLQLTQTIKDAWRRKQVVSVLYLDVSQAFPNVAHEHLLERMEEMGLSEEVVNWTESFLSDRTTSLVFDDYASDPVQVPTGVPQGLPLSVILYLIYSSSLLEIGSDIKGKKDNIYGFIDDTALVAVSNSMEENIDKLQKLAAEGLIWAKDSASSFDIAKYQLVHHTRRTDSVADQNRTMIVAGHMIKPRESAKYLGMHIDQCLNFKEHIEYAVGKGVKAAVALTQLANTKIDMPHKFVHRLFIGLVAPRMEYALPVWYNPMKEGEGRRSGAVGIACKLSKPQHLACKVMAGGLRSTSTDALDYHANVLPTHLHLNLVAYKFAARLCTLPPTHPLYKTVRRCKHQPRFHRSPIHHLLNALKDFQEEWEHIDTSTIQKSDCIKFDIALNRDQAEQRAATTPWGDHLIFSDGSGFKSGIGVAAWSQTYENAPHEEVHHHLYLGPDTHHTVFEAELAGAILALDIIKNTARLTKATILIDSQAAILALQSRQTKSGRYLVEEFHCQACRLQSKRRSLRIRIQWVPGHVDVVRNEMVDAEAKLAAQGSSTPLYDARSVLAKPLPRSKAAAKADFSKRVRAQWTDRWLASSKGSFTKCFNHSPPSPKIQHIFKNMSRAEASMFTQLHTGHIPLNAYLFRSRAAPSPICPHCNVLETVTHFLLVCRRYSDERQALRRRMRLGNLQLRHLLSTTSRHIFATLTYMQCTKRFSDLSNNKGGPPP